MKVKIGIIGLGYVGLPLAVSFAKNFEVFGMDLDKNRIKDLKKFEDITGEIKYSELKKTLNNNLYLTSNIKDLKICNVIIITVPTPVKHNKSPDLNSIIEATRSLSLILKKGDTVVYESTVYPGLTEEVCVPIIEEITNFKYNQDFFVGYSPERINPGDKIHRLESITKIVSGSSKKTLNFLSKLYGSIIKAGVYQAPNIKTAEAAKVIENTQRDINIAFMNELAIIFNKMNIDTNEVLKAAETKWNFLKFYPGLVGGHCIGVDPYYLAYKSKKLGYKPEMILAGRKINDQIPFYIANEVTHKISAKKNKSSEIEILILGVTFKENCPDTRNSKVIDLYNELLKNDYQVDVYDPYINDALLSRNFKNSRKISLSSNIRYDVVILAVGHKEFQKFDPKKVLKNDGFVYDIKGFYNDLEFQRL
tara:strand:+ start:79333 stop:80595 length:1263 start_codon:yes stop_codon:yes gene_type:complete